MDEPAMPSLSRQTAQGAVWLMAGKFLARGMDALVLIVLARLLSPADFGLVALGMTLVYVVEAVFELPVGQALLRQPELSRAHLDTAFTLGLARGAVVVGLMLALAWPYAAFAQEPRLVPLLSVLALAPLFRSLYSPAFIRFTRAMDFRPNFACDVAAKVTTGVVAISVAWWTGSYWALAAGTVTGPAVTALLSFALAPYRPDLTLREWPIFAHILGWNLVSQMLSSLNWQFDRMLLGRFVPAASLGRFAISSDIAAIPHQAVMVPALQPMAAAMFRAGQDGERVRSMYLKSSAALALVGAPVFAGLATLADPAVRLLLGPQWHEAAPLLAALALAALPLLPTLPLSPALFARHRGQWYSLLCLVELAVRVPVTVLAVLHEGVAGAVHARIGLALVVLTVGMAVARQAIGVPARAQLAAIARPAASAFAMAYPLTFAADALELQPAGLVLWLSVGGVVMTGAVLYVTTLLGLWLASGRPDGLEAVAFGRVLSGWRALRRRLRGTRVHAARSD